MSILLERTKSQQAAQQVQGAPVLAEQAGSVQWAVVDGARVNGGGDKVAEIAGAYSSLIVGCDHIGHLHYLVQDGAIVKRGDVLAYVKPLAASQTRPATRATNHTAPNGKTPQRPSGEALAPSAAAIVQEEPEVVSLPPTNGTRRSTMPPALELTLLDEEEPQAPVMPPAPKKREKVTIIKWNWHPSTSQKQKILERHESLRARGFDYGILELQRVAAEWLATVDERTLVEMMEAQRDREVAGRYGYGAKPQG